MAAETWISAYDDAVSSQPPTGPLSAARFYATDVVFDSTREELTGRAAVMELDQSLAVSLRNHELGEIYLDGDGFLRTEALSWVASAFPTVRTWEMAPEGIVSMQGYDWLQSLVTRHPGFEGAQGAADLAADHVRAWSRADHATLRDLYWTGATYQDSLYGIRAHGREAILALADPENAPATTLQRAEDLYDEGVLAPFQPPRDSPAIFVTRQYRRPDTRHPARLLLLQRSTRACPGASAVLLTLDDVGLVVAERRFHALESVRACAARDDLHEGWWQERELPLPLSQRVTGHVDLASGSIEIRNGTPELEAFVRWGLDRFEEAGLTQPRVRSIAFDPFSSWCAEFDGYAEPASGSTAIVVCDDAGGLDRGRAGEDAPCTSGRCPSNLLPSTRNLLLHELGHAWLVPPDLDRDTRVRFMSHIGAPAWSDGDVPYHRRGVELAASTLAWGLSGDPSARIGFRSAPCESLAEGFRILTGAQPLTTCSSADDAADRAPLAAQ